MKAKLAVVSTLLVLFGIQACGFVWFKKPRRLKGMIPVGFWNSGTKTFIPYSLV